LVPILKAIGITKKLNMKIDSNFDTRFNEIF